MARTKTRKRVHYRVEVVELTTTPPHDPGERSRTDSRVLLTQEKDAIDLPAILKAVNGMA